MQIMFQTRSHHRRKREHSGEHYNRQCCLIKIPDDVLKDRGPGLLIPDSLALARLLLSMYP